MPRPTALRRIYSGGIVTAPNALSLFRLLLIPAFVYLYEIRCAPAAALGVLALSAATDVLDGHIARRFHAVTDLGKLLDPLADRLTQCALLLCVCRHHGAARLLLALFAVKELALLPLAVGMLRRTGAVPSARWHGKLNSAVLEGTMALLLLPGLPPALPTMLTALSGAVMLLSFALYARQFAAARPTAEEKTP